MNQQLFDEVVGTPPPSTVDVVAIVARERRRSAVRRIGGTMAAVLGLAVSAGIVAAGQHGPAGVAPPPVAADNRFQLVANDRDSAQLTAKRLAEALDAALRNAAPDARWIRSNIFSDAAPDGQPPRLFTDNTLKQHEQMFSGGTGVLADGRRGMLALHILRFEPVTGKRCDEPKCVAARALPREDPNKKRELFLSCRGETGCTERTGPNGERMTIRTDFTKLKRFPGPWKAANFQVYVELVDGRLLNLVSTNEYGVGERESTLQQQDPPLTSAQLTQMAIEVTGRIRA
ncbi:hypothetical protein [Plantactinospora soyae]|uniref:Uncharacterized protein n=1 Tax=Plantactinospora soyae TaxID=1544732 RepID=A0A927MCA3_9ACTN|nr:hypothetical protein [Plantactinospora soyae]MBE1491839.1 hypothetical protein [Plantactinospora soyae]